MSDNGQPRPTREVPNRKNTNVRNLVWAIGLNLVIVAVLAVLVVGLGDPRDSTQGDTAVPPVELAASAERAHEVLGFAIAAPEPDGFTPRAAEVNTSEPHTWRVRYTSPQQRLITLVQQDTDGPALMAEIDGVIRTADTENLQGATCTWLDLELRGRGSGPTAGSRATHEGKDAGLVCENGLLVFGGASREDVQRLTEAALADINGARTLEPHEKRDSA